MEIQNQVEILTRLGLTINQAKIYLSLAQSKPSTVTQISKSTNLAREVVYRAMPKLQKMGLITKIISFPTEFKAATIDSAISILLERRTKETAEVQEKAKELVRHIKNRKGSEHVQGPQLIVISGEERLREFAGKQLLTARKSIDAVTTIEKFSGWMRVLPPIFKKLLARNVKIRIVVAGGEKEMNDENLDELKKSSNFKIKFIPDQILVTVGIIDNIDTLINPSPKVAYSKASFYWSNDPAIIALSETFFENYWSKNEL